MPKPLKTLSVPTPIAKGFLDRGQKRFASPGAAFRGFVTLEGVRPERKPPGAILGQDRGPAPAVLGVTQSWRGLVAFRELCPGHRTAVLLPVAYDAWAGLRKSPHPRAVE